jgi:hypothetical protein
MKSVDIPDVGVVEFPDEMDNDAISKVIKEKILPQAKAASAETKAAEAEWKEIDDYWSGRQHAEEQRRPGIVTQFGNDLSRSVSQLQQLGYGLGALGADAVGADETAQDWLQRYQDISQDIQENNPPVIGSFRNIENIADMGRYAVEAVGENVLMAVPSLFTGGVGAIAARKMAEKGAKEFVEAQVLSGVAREVAEKQAGTYLAKVGIGGGVAGALPSNVGMEMGSIYGDVYEQTGVQAPGTAAVLGTVAGALDTIGEGLGLARVFGRELSETAARSLISRYGAAIAEQFVTQASTEALQTVVERYAVALQDPSKEVFSQQGVDQIFDAFLKGGIAGAGVGVVAEGAGSIMDWAKRRGVEPTVENLQTAAAEGDTQAIDLLRASGLMSDEQLAALSPEAAERFAQRYQSKLAAEQDPILAAQRTQEARDRADLEGGTPLSEGLRRYADRRADTGGPKREDILKAYETATQQVDAMIEAGHLKPEERDLAVRRSVIGFHPELDKRQEVHPQTLLLKQARIDEILDLPADQYTPEVADEFIRLKTDLARSKPSRVIELGERHPEGVGKGHPEGSPLAGAPITAVDGMAATGYTDNAGLRQAVDKQYQAQELQRKRTEQAFKLARFRAGKAGPTVRDVQAGGRPEGGVESQEPVFMDQGYPVRLGKDRYAKDANGNTIRVREVHRYDPRTGEATGPFDPVTNEPIGYEVPVSQLTVGQYATDKDTQSPRRSQQFEEEAKKATVGSYENVKTGKMVRPAGAKQRIDTVQGPQDVPNPGLPRQTYRTTAPDPTVPGAEGPTSALPGQGPVPRAPRPEQGEGPGYDLGSDGQGANARGGTTGEDWVQREARRRERMKEQGDRDETQDEQGQPNDWGKARSRYENQKTGYSGKPKGVDEDGWPHVDEDGYILSDKGGPLSFSPDDIGKSAMIKRLKELRAAHPDAGIVNAAHPRPMKRDKKTGGAVSYWTLQATRPKPAKAPPNQEQAAPEQPASTGPQRVLSAPVAESKPAPGFVRMYHGGLSAGQDAPTWFSSDRRYAEGYATKDGREGAGLLYVDVPENHPLIEPEYPEQSVAQGFHVNVELPAEFARAAKPVPDWTPPNQRTREADEGRDAGSDRGAGEERQAPEVDAETAPAGGSQEATGVRSGDRTAETRTGDAKEAGREGDEQTAAVADEPFESSDENFLAALMAVAGNNPAGLTKGARDFLLDNDQAAPNTDGQLELTEEGQQNLTDLLEQYAEAPKAKVAPAKKERAPRSPKEKMTQRKSQALAKIQPIDPNNVPDPVNGKPTPSDVDNRERLLIISCGIAKSDAPGEIRALDRYTGPRFADIKKWMSENPGQKPKIVILSGRFGYLPDWFPIPNYDEKLSSEKAKAFIKLGIGAENTIYKKLTDTLANGKTAPIDILGEVETGHQFRDVMIVAGGDYTPVLNAAVTQLAQAGAISPDAAINRATGGIGMQRQQMIGWLNAAPKPEPVVKAGDPLPDKAFAELSREGDTVTLKGNVDGRTVLLTSTDNKDAEGVEFKILHPHPNSVSDELLQKITDTVQATESRPVTVRRAANPKARGPAKASQAETAPAESLKDRMLAVAKAYAELGDTTRAAGARAGAVAADLKEAEVKQFESGLASRSKPKTEPAKGTIREIDGVTVIATGRDDFPWAGARKVESGPQAGWQPDTAQGVGATAEEAAADVVAGQKRVVALRTKRTDAQNRWNAAVEAAKGDTMPGAFLLKGATRYGDGRVTTGEAKDFLRDMGLTAKQADKVVADTTELDVTSGGARLYDLARIVRTGQNVLDVAKVIDEVTKTAPPKAETAPKPLSVAAGVDRARKADIAGNPTDLEKQIYSLHRDLERRKDRKDLLAKRAREAKEHWNSGPEDRRKLGGLSNSAMAKDRTARERDENLAEIKKGEAKLKELVANLATQPKQQQEAILVSSLFGGDPKVVPTVDEEARNLAFWKLRLESLAPRAETIGDVRGILDSNVMLGILSRETANAIKSVLARMPSDGLKGIRLIIQDRLTPDEHAILGTHPGVLGQYLDLNPTGVNMRVLTVSGVQGPKAAARTFIHENAHILFSMISDADKAAARQIYDGVLASRHALTTNMYAENDRFEEWFAESMADYYIGGLQIPGNVQGNLATRLTALLNSLYKRIVDAFSGEKGQVDAFFAGLQASRPAPTSVNGAIRRELRGVSTTAILSNPVGKLTGDWKAWRAGWQEFIGDTTEAWANRGQRPDRQYAVTSFARWFFYSADGEYRAVIEKFNSPTLNFLADVFHAKAGVRQGLDPKLASKLGMKLPSNATFDEAVTRKLGVELNQLSRILKPFDQDAAAIDRIVDMVQRPSARRSDPESVAAREIAILLKGLHTYMKDAGVNVGEVKTGYFPREIDVAAVIKDSDGFVAAATKAYRVAGLAVDKAKEAADNWLTNILYGGEGSPVRASTGTTPSFVQSRVLTKEADQILKAFYQRDPRMILGSYISRATRRAEIARRFGDNWRNWAAIEKQIRAEDPAAAGALPLLRDYAATAAGVQQHNVSGIIRSGSSMVRTVTSVSLLEKSWFSSLGEAIMPMLRTGNWRDMIPALTKTLTEFRRELKDLPPSLAAELAADIGAIAGSGVNSLMAARFAGGDPLSRGQAKVLSAYFRRILLEQWTTATRVASTERGAVFIRRLAGDVAGRGLDPKSARIYLAELGVPEAQLDQFVRFVDGFGDTLPTASDLDRGGEMGAAYRTALLRFVDQTVMRPSATTRPRWASHPVGAVLFQLQAFSYAFSKNVVLRDVQMAKKAWDNKEDMHATERLLMAAPLIFLLPVLATTQFLVGELRDWLFMDPERQKAQTFTSKVERAISRAGITGALDPYLQMVTSARYSKDPLSTLTGPFLGVLGQGLGALQQYIANNSPGTNAAERRAYEALYDVLFEPGVNILLGYSPFSPLTTLITMGLLPAMRDDFVDGVAGPRIGHKQQPIYGLTEILAGKQFESKAG